MGVQAYNLKLIMDKDVNDVIKPAWIKRSITLGKAAPFHHKLVCLCEVWKDGGIDACIDISSMRHQDVRKRLITTRVRVWTKM